MKTNRNKTPNIEMIENFLSIGIEKIGPLSAEFLILSRNKENKAYYIKEWLSYGGKKEEIEEDTFTVTPELLENGSMILIMKMPKVHFVGEVLFFAITIEKEGDFASPVIYLLELTKHGKYNLYLYGYVTDKDMKFAEKKHLLLQKNIQPSVQAFLNSIEESRKNLKYGYHVI